jgi:hypothetical protein
VCQRDLWVHLGVPATSLGAMVPHLGAPGTCLGAPGTCVTGVTTLFNDILDHLYTYLVRTAVYPIFYNESLEDSFEVSELASLVKSFSSCASFGF